MEIYKVTEKDLIGDIEGFPIEVMQKMVERQFEQHGKCDVSAFQDCRSSYKGFTWSQSREEHDFWEEVIARKKFNLFFERYPKQDPPLPRMVLVWDEHEDERLAVERELLYILPESLDVSNRYVCRIRIKQKESKNWFYMKELPNPKKMTMEEIEKELGYKIEIINNK